MKTSYWFALLVIFHTWVGYLLLLMVLSRLQPERLEEKRIYPYVTVLLTVHNEAQVIEERIKNLLATDYPKDLLEVLVASDGSTDETNDIVNIMGKKDSCIRLFEAKRSGKSSTQNRIIPRAKGEIIILTDAGTAFNKDTITNLVGGFTDDKVGCVSGKLVLVQENNSISEGQGFYWKYEILLRRLESDIGVLHTASGPVMAFRRNLFVPFESRYGDDCIIPLNIISQGYKVLHNDKAVAYDMMPSTVEGELNARTRMTLRNITGTLSKYILLNPLRYPLISSSILSHKVLRWLTPYFMIIFFMANLFLLREGIFYEVTFYCQLIFYFFGIIGFIAHRNGYSLPIASQTFSFMLANIGFFQGILKATLGQKITIYKNQSRGG